MKFIKEHKKIIIIATVALLLIAGAYIGLFYIPNVRRRKALGITSSSAKGTTGRHPDGSLTLWRGDSFPLSKGSSGEKVKKVQRYLKVEADGYWGPKTEEAFQKSNLPKIGGKSEISYETYYGFQIDQK